MPRPKAKDNSLNASGMSSNQRINRNIRSAWSKYMTRPTPKPVPAKASRKG